MRTIRTQSIDIEDLRAFRSLLQPQNAIIMEFCLQTGLRISDALNITAQQFGEQFEVFESKTKKIRPILVDADLLSLVKLQMNDQWLFPGRWGYKPKTRQAVWADIKKVSRRLELPYNVGVHSLRKNYARARYGDLGGGLDALKAIQEELGHEDLSTTLIYLMDDLLGTKKVVFGVPKY